MPALFWAKLSGVKWSVWRTTATSCAVGHSRAGRARYCRTPEVRMSEAFEASLSIGVKVYFTTKRAV